VFIVGAAKAGTTSLHTYLQQHPQIYMSPVKEPHFFYSNDLYARRFDESSYLALFEGATEELLRGESSALYLCDPAVPGRISRVSPDAKIIIMLRDPVQRVFSHYLMDDYHGKHTHSFLEVLQMSPPPGFDGPYNIYVELGRYCQQVSRYLDVFGENVLVMFYEEFFADVRTHLRDVFRFLGVDEEYANAVDVSPQNSYQGKLNALGRAAFRAYRSHLVRAIGKRLAPLPAREQIKRSVLKKHKPRIDPEAARFLAGAYGGQAECLSRILGRDVPWELR
jgi:hypothetical protein